jgi:hypothetical protein
VDLLPYPQGRFKVSTLVGLGPPPGHRQQGRDVVHHRLNSGSDRPKASQPQQVESCGSQCGHHSGAIAAIPVRILVQLGVADPVPALNSPAVANQLQQRFWRGAQAGEEQMGGVKGLAIAATGGHDFLDPAGADPGLTDVLWCLFGAEGPGDGAAVADLVIRCHERDLALSLKLAANLPVERFLVGFHCQEEVGPLLLELPKNGRWL